MRNPIAVAAFLLLAPIAAGAQSAIPVPKALLFPNFDNVLVGKTQALEGGAYIARANDAAANFYNPAGLAAAEKTSLNASSTGYVFSRLTSKASGESISSTKLEGVPGYFGAVIGAPLFDTTKVRLGFSVTRSVSWSPGGIDQSVSQPGGDFDRLTVATESSFGTQVYQGAVAWAPMKQLRLGLSAGVAQTTFKSNVALSGGISPDGQPGQFLSTLRTDGSDSAVVFGIGAQVDVAAGLTVGALVRPPGIRIGGSSLVTQESTLVQAASATSTFFRDDQGTFQYKMPLEASVGLAYRFGAVELEFDLRYHDAVSQYDFYRSAVPYQVFTQRPDGTASVTTQPPPLVKYSSRRVYNGALGANWRVAKIATLHGGFYNTLSPVADPATSPLRKADLYGFTGGVDFQLDKFGASIGAGYQFGSSSPTGVAVGGSSIAASDVSLQSISILYAISYQL